MQTMCCISNFTYKATAQIDGIVKHTALAKENKKCCALCNVRS